MGGVCELHSREEGEGTVVHGVIGEGGGEGPEAGSTSDEQLKEERPQSFVREGGQLCEADVTVRGEGREGRGERGGGGGDMQCQCNTLVNTMVQ